MMLMGNDVRKHASALVGNYAFEMEMDLDWASDWSAPDHEYSRLGEGWWNFSNELEGPSGLPSREGTAYGDQPMAVVGGFAAAGRSLGRVAIRTATSKVVQAHHVVVQPGQSHYPGPRTLRR
jgi:hypothetical protein